MPEAPHLRVSDLEREQAADAIREHYAAGRLDSAEFEERLQAAYGARTRSELDALSADLPALPPRPPTSHELLRQSISSSELVRSAAAGGGIFVACTAIWALTGADGSFWPKWVLVLTLLSVVRGIRRGTRGPRRRRALAPGGGHHYSYHYEYRYGDGREHAHQHEHEG